MVAASVGELGGSDVEYALPGAFRNHVHYAGEVLVGIAEPHTTADSALEIRGAAAHEEGYHALILVPDIHGTVEFGDGRFHPETPEEIVPEGLEFRKCRIHLLRGREGLHHFAGGSLVYNARGLELVSGLVFDISEHEDNILACARLKSEVEALRSDGAPAVSHAVAGCAGQHLLRSVEAIVHPEESLTVGIEAVEGPVRSEECVMIAALPVFRLMINRIAFHLHFPRREIALEVLHVGGCIPEAPLHERVEAERFAFARPVRQAQPVQFAAPADWHEEKGLHTESVLFAGDCGVSHPMPAFVEIKDGLAGLPARIPHGIAILDIEITASGVHWHSVVAVAENPAELGILAEAVAAGGI